MEAADRQTAVALSLESGGLETLCSLYEEAEDLEDAETMRRAFAVLRAALLSCREPMWRACTQDAYFYNVLGILDRAWPRRKGLHAVIPVSRAFRHRRCWQAPTDPGSPLSPRAPCRRCRCDR